MQFTIGGNGTHPVTRVGWSDASYVQLHQLVRQLGNKWTVIGAMMNKTPYVCSAAYKRLLDRLSTAEREGNEQLLRLFDKDDYNDDDDDDGGGGGGGGDDDYSPPPPSSPINASSSSIQTAVWSRSEDERLKLLVGSLGRKWQVMMMMRIIIMMMRMMMMMMMI